MIQSALLRASILLLIFQGAPTGWQDLYNQGLEQVKAANGKSAIGFLSQAVKANPKPSVSPRYTPYFYLGLCYDSIGDEKNALLYYEKSQALKEVSSFPDDQEVLESHLSELRESSRTFQVIVKKDGKPVTPRENPGQKVSEATPKKDAVAATRPPSVGPGPSQPVPGTLAELGKDRDPEMLRQAVLEYLSGNYPSALRAARQYLDQGGRQVDKASFVAGAALFSQFLLTGQKDQSLERSANRYLKDASPYSPPRNWISPVVLEHYRQVTAE